MTAPITERQSRCSSGWSKTDGAPAFITRSKPSMYVRASDWSVPTPSVQTTAGTDIPFALDLHGIVGVTVPAVISAEGISTFEPDSLTHIVSFQCVIDTGAPAVFDHPIIHRYSLAVVGSVVLYFFTDADIVDRRSIGFFKVLDHRCKTGHVRHLNIGYAVLDNSCRRF